VSETGPEDLLESEGHLCELFLYEVRGSVCVRINTPLENATAVSLLYQRLGVLPGCFRTSGGSGDALCAERR
jgi:hypothetical protein